jgi:transposase-like protein
MMNGKTEQILKVDKTGRVWTPLAQREAALDEFERSGMPASKFAERIGVKYSTFTSWAHQRRKQRGGADAVRERRGEPAALKWVEAVPEQARPSPAMCALVVHLPGGARMEVGDAAQVALAAGLLRALGAGGAGC